MRVQKAQTLQKVAIQMDVGSLPSSVNGTPQLMMAFDPFLVFCDPDFALGDKVFEMRPPEFCPLCPGGIYLRSYPILGIFESFGQSWDVKGVAHCRPTRARPAILARPENGPKALLGAIGKA